MTHEDYVAMGQKGGQATKERYGDAFYRENGRKGGAATKALGTDYRALGRKGGRKKKRKEA